MSVVVITGSAGLIGSEATEYYASLGYRVIGIDNDMRQDFFGPEGTTRWNRSRLEKNLGANYVHYDVDIRDHDALSEIFLKYKQDIALIIHTAAQPSHDWAAREPLTDFHINASGTLNLLEMMRLHCPEAVFIFTSTNKVYGDRPNELPYLELESRWELDSGHPCYDGIPETLSVDQCLHSLFGASKLAADVIVQEYGRYFQLKTVCFRGGVLSGSRQSGVQLHGFINYLLKCAMTNSPYTIFGYKGKQVRDIIHASDVIAAFHAFFQHPRRGGEVYNLGGGRDSNISILETIEWAQHITGKKLNYSYCDQPRTGDHIWYISDTSKFRKHYPNWSIQIPAPQMMELIYDENKDRWKV
ncbi:NAD-dependent epimerase/dehydratase family protein [Paenibacillus sp. MZ04-78.2]|uniref:NAD-dependent epimerase/dehydratase family protein n=1 Tax=Paenibacillus sp. MZ04-78.2 TaxID=2962034 RepID=UPI0020B6EACC|nr:NAD-dependent epimerase/dehydratase family protein [Paenibacillus sp. MZ04-78.2]MCP3773546.1 NAD-dependent epimerase/dehydratase family protein [Paenibacillus sp. MZ04-78.2]